MPVTTFLEYAEAIRSLFDRLLTAGLVERARWETDQRSTVRGMISGILFFADGCELHFREFLDTSLTDPRMMYAYHYQDLHAALIVRYDNALHRPELRHAPHKHTPNGATKSSAPTLEQVLDEVLRRK